MLKNSYSLFLFLFLLWKHQLKKHLLGAFKIGLSHSANNNQISLSLQWADGWPQQTTRAASVKKLTLISWHKEENPFFTFTDGGAKACWIYKTTRDIDQNTLKSLNGSLMSAWTIEDGSSTLMNLILDCCDDECANLRITHLVNLWLCWDLGRTERNFWNKDSLRNKICSSSSFALKKMQPNVIFSNDKLIIRSSNFNYVVHSQDSCSSIGIS